MSFTGLVFITSATAVAGAEAKNIVKGEPLEMKPVIGGFTLGVFLFAAGIVNEKIAAYLCYLIIVSSLVINGLPLFKLLAKEN